MSDAGGCSGPGSDGNEAPQASPSLTRPWWRASPSPSKRRQSHLRTAGSGLCMAARSLSATLDAAAGEAAGAEVADSGAAASAIAALDLDAIQHDRAAPPVQVTAGSLLPNSLRPPSGFLLAPEEFACRCTRMSPNL